MEKRSQNKLFKVAAYIAVVGILGIISMYVGVFLSILRESHKIFWGIICVGIFLVICRRFKRKSPFDRFYYSQQAAQVLGQTYYQTKAKYTYGLAGISILLVFLYSYTSVFMQFLDSHNKIAFFIFGSSGPRLIITTGLFFSIPIHILVAVYIHLGNGYRACLSELITKAEERRVAELHKAEEARAEKQREAAEKIRRDQEVRAAEIHRIRELHNQFWRRLIDEYGVAPWIYDTMYGGISAKNIMNFPVTEDAACGVTLETFQLYSMELPKKYLENSKRVAWIEESITMITRRFPQHSDEKLRKQLSLSMTSTMPIQSWDDHAKTLYIAEADAFYSGEWNQKTDALVRKMNDIVAARLVYYRNQYKIAKTGEDGEIAVQQVLDMHPGAFFTLHNIRLEYIYQETRKISIETDTLVLAPNGIFAVEVKNYGSTGKYKIIVAPDGNWYKEVTKIKRGISRNQSKEDSGNTEKESIRESLPSAFAQNSLHIGGLELIINEILGRSMENRVYVENVVVIANDEVEIESSLQGRQILTRVGTLYDCLCQSRERLFTEEELIRIKTELERRNLPAKKYAINDYRGEVQGFASILGQLEKERDKVEVAIRQCRSDHPEICKPLTHPTA